MSQNYSIWFVPDEDSQEYQTLDTLISEYAQAFQDAPDFKPHVTILGGIDAEQAVVEDRAKQLSDGLDAFEMEFIGVSCSTTHHQCVFLLVKPTEMLLSLNQSANEFFDRPDGMYVPHLSLIYSEMSPEARIDAVESLESETLPNSIPIDSIEVVDTKGLESTWETTLTLSL